MKPVFYSMILVFGFLLGACPGLANETKPKLLIGPSDGPMPKPFAGPWFSSTLDVLCAVPSPAPKENTVFKLSCHDRETQPCLLSLESLPLQHILNRFASAKAISIKRKGSGCYEFIFVHHPKL